MKHTYLYPLPAGARFLWMVGRAGVADLFGEAEHTGGVFMGIRLAEEIDHARRTVMRLIENSPRVCLGRGYTIPNSQAVHSDYAELHGTTEGLTELFWDAPRLDDILYSQAVAHLLTHPVPGRDSNEEIISFLKERPLQRIIPVWM